MNPFFIISIVLAIACSCNTPKREIKRAFGTQVEMPFSLRYYSGKYLEYERSDDALATMLIWYDSTQCSGCKLSAINGLEDYVRFCKDTVAVANVDIVFSPPAGIEESFDEAIINAKCKYPLFVDYEGVFAKYNRKLPKSSNLHTFLLDANGKIILVGDPTHNNKLWELYKKYIKLLCDNNGKLPN